MSLEFLLGKVIINGIKADVLDKLQFCKDLRNGKVKIKNIIDFDGCIDILTY